MLWNLLLFFDGGQFLVVFLFYCLFFVGGKAVSLDDVGENLLDFLLEDLLAEDSLEFLADLTPFLEGALAHGVAVLALLLRGRKALTAHSSNP